MAPWLIDQVALIRALLFLAGLGESDAMSRCEQISGNLSRRFGTQPGLRVKVQEIAGLIASSRLRWTQDVADLDASVQSYQAALGFPETSAADRARSTTTSRSRSGAGIRRVVTRTIWSGPGGTGEAALRAQPDQALDGDRDAPEPGRERLQHARGRRRSIGVRWSCFRLDLVGSCRTA